MRFFHLSDLHIGKQLHGYSMYEEQKYILEQIVQLALNERPDAIVIAGDIFDKSVPSGEAYMLFDTFLNDLAEISPNIPTMIIAGNHDGAQRLHYASSFLAKHEIYISAFAPMKPEERMDKVTLEDEHGEVDFYLLPFTKPENVCRVMEEETVDADRRNVLVSHQFYCHAGHQPDGCDSEQMRLSIGGIDQIDTDVLEMFDYVALGHIHGAQKVGRESIRYCGTPLKYSVSEEHHKKSVTMVTLEEPGQEPVIETLDLQPLREVRSIRGSLTDIIRKAAEPTCHDYVSITLTDEFEQFHARDKLLEAYDHVLEIKVDNAKSRATIYENEEVEEEQTVEEAFSHFYEEMHGSGMSEEEMQIMKDVFAQIEGSVKEV